MKKVFRLVLLTFLCSFLFNLDIIQAQNDEDLIDVQELNKIVDKEDVKIIAVSNNDKYLYYIPNTIIVNVDDFTEERNGIEGYIANRETIEKLLSNIGYQEGEHLIIYDNSYGQNASRLWWTLEYYDVDNIRLLNGGLTVWEDEGLKTVKKSIKPEKKTTVRIDEIEPEILSDLDDVKASFDNEKIVVLDVRSEAEFKRGHIPGAINIPFTMSLNKDRTFKSINDLKTIYQDKGITPDLDKIIIHCTKGFRGSHTFFVLSELLGYENASVYDGSFLEYQTKGLPIEKS